MLHSDPTPAQSAPTSSQPEHNQSPQSAPTSSQPEHNQPPQLAPTSSQPQPNPPPKSAPTSSQPQPNPPPKSVPTSSQPQPNPLLLLTAFSWPEYDLSEPLEIRPLQSITNPNYTLIADDVSKSAPEL
ncbi:hypothetical protein RND81_13G123600 [Saponaria officinalis]|uniref:Uncharacterized protein n=1 Tax=Saponaria officinalis TaxID=3572 RepID=A0AAW1GZW9_SAPOF